MNEAPPYPSAVSSTAHALTSGLGSLATMFRFGILVEAGATWWLCRLSFTQIARTAEEKLKPNLEDACASRVNIGLSAQRSADGTLEINRVSEMRMRGIVKRIETCNSTLRSRKRVSHTMPI